MCFSLSSASLHQFLPVISWEVLSKVIKKWFTWLEVERTRLLAKPAVFKMPKSFLVKNKKARRAEDEIQDSTKAAQDEDKPPGKGKLQTSLQAKIALVAVST